VGGCLCGEMFRLPAVVVAQQLLLLASAHLLLLPWQQLLLGAAPPLQLLCSEASQLRSVSLHESSISYSTHNPSLLLTVAGPPAHSYYSLKPDIKVIAPWREWDLLSRTKLIEWAESRGIPVPSSKRGEPPFSMDANLLHISYEGGCRVVACHGPGHTGHSCCTVSACNALLAEIIVILQGSGGHHDTGL
jgi:hypothetical protein